MSYIPDITERFPEGYGGVDCTADFFPGERGVEDYHYEDKENYMSSEEYDEYCKDEVIDAIMYDYNVNKKTAEGILNIKEKAKVKVAEINKEIEKVNREKDAEIIEFLNSQGYEREFKYPDDDEIPF